ncbi:hypothetical protein SK128_004231 [Halocaridina rubra]|uniref:Uncharacterized protein n=1 Tax=Halocaridina rubra TaxID=373956 RepID=A0AAN8X342_HALRR
MLVNIISIADKHELQSRGYETQLTTKETYARLQSRAEETELRSRKPYAKILSIANDTEV